MEDVSFYAQLAWIISEAFLGASGESQRSHGCKGRDHVIHVIYIYILIDIFETKKKSRF